MSFTSLSPAPIPFGALAPGDLDNRPGANWPGTLSVGVLTIVSVGAPIITRTDDVPINGGDLTVLNIAVSADGLSFGWSFQAGTNVGTYLIAFPLTLSDGSVLHRSITVSVAANIG